MQLFLQQGFKARILHENISSCSAGYSQAWESEYTSLYNLYALTVYVVSAISWFHINSGVLDRYRAKINVPGRFYCCGHDNQLHVWRGLKRVLDNAERCSGRCCTGEATVKIETWWWPSSVGCIFAVAVECSEHVRVDNRGYGRHVFKPSLNRLMVSTKRIRK